MPLEAIGYGNGLAEWNWNVLPQLMAARSSGAAWGGLSAGAMGSPWASRVGMVPGRAMGMGMNPGFGFQPSRWAAGMPHAAVAGAGGGPGPWPMPRSMSMSMGMGMGGPGNIHRVMDRISCDGGYGSRRGRFN